MAIILTLKYEYVASEHAWFTKNFDSYSELFKWLREDSILILPHAILTDEKLKKSLILTKLALPKVKIFVIINDTENQESDFFNFVRESDLEEKIRLSIVNKHVIIDNREKLKKILEMNSLI